MDKQLQESQNQISKLSNEFRSLEKKLDNEKRKEKEINKKISCLRTCLGSFLTYFWLN
ncbi:hypothetical protein [Spiroplasma endosymbiont of Dactylopius coccus]